jgi:hypothetical protein
MARLIPKRASSPWPADPPLRPFVRAFRVAKDFTCEGIRFHKGELVSHDDPLAQAIHGEFPEYLVPAQNRD